MDTSKNTDMVSMVNQTEDDLRAGMFEFITDSSEWMNEWIISPLSFSFSQVSV